MKIKEYIKIKQIGEESVLISNEGNNVDFTRVISLNKSAEFLIGGSFGKEITASDWADKLVEEYGIDKQRALSDAQALLDRLLEAGVLYG